MLGAKYSNWIYHESPCASLKQFIRSLPITGGSVGGGTVTVGDTIGDEVCSGGLIGTPIVGRGPDVGSCCRGEAAAVGPGWNLGEP